MGYDIYDIFSVYEAEEAPDKRFRASVVKKLTRERLGEAKKPRGYFRKAIIIPLAAALIAATAITAAAGGADVFSVFRSLFPKNTENLKYAGMTELNKTVDAGEYYTVTVNGIMADSGSAVVCYDIEYKDEIYFKDGSLTEDYRKWSPVFFTGGGVSSGAYGHSVSPDGENNTVSYVQRFSCDSFKKDIYGNYKIKLSCTCEKEWMMTAAGAPELLARASFDITVPQSKEKTVYVNAEIPVKDGKTALIKTITVSPLSVQVEFTTPPERADYSPFDCYPYNETTEPPIIIIMKDGTVIDPYTREYFGGSGGGGSLLNEEQEIMECSDGVTLNIPIAPDEVSQIKFRGHAFDIK